MAFGRSSRATAALSRLTKASDELCRWRPKSARVARIRKEVVDRRTARGETVKLPVHKAVAFESRSLFRRAMRGYGWLKWRLLPIRDWTERHPVMTRWIIILALIWAVGG